MYLQLKPVIYIHNYIYVRGDIGSGLKKKKKKKRKEKRGHCVIAYVIKHNINLRFHTLYAKGHVSKSYHIQSVNMTSDIYVLYLEILYF